METAWCFRRAAWLLLEGLGEMKPLLLGGCFQGTAVPGPVTFGHFRASLEAPLRVDNAECLHHLPECHLLSHLLKHQHILLQPRQERTFSVSWQGFSNFPTTPLRAGERKESTGIRGQEWSFRNTEMHLCFLMFHL